MNVFVVEYESHPYERRVTVVGAGSSLALAQGIAAQWIAQNYGYTAFEWVEGHSEPGDYPFWYVDVHGYIVVIKEVEVDAPAQGRPHDDD